MATFNPSLSDYGQQVANERTQLLGQLVERLAGVQPGEGPYGALMDVCLATVQHPRFADTNPRDVAEQYDRLAERFGEHAQLGKQRALQLLQKQLLGLRLDSLQYEFQYRLLSFLYAASRRPLSTPYVGGELVELLEQAARTAVVGPPTYLTDASSDGSWQDELGAYSPRSQLSDWSHVGAEELEGHAATAAVAVTAAGAADEGMVMDLEEQQGLSGIAEGEDDAADTAPEPLGSPSPAAAAAGGVARLALPPLPQPRWLSPYSPTSLSVWLASKQSGGQPARLLEPQLCFHERELVQQVIHMLKGMSTPGPAFELDAAGDAYMPRTGVHLHSSSHGSLHALLQRFARVGTALRCVQAFCAAAQRAAGTPPRPWTSAAAAGSVQQMLSLPTMAALAAAVAEQQQGLQQQLLVIEAALSCGAMLTLMQLQQRTAALAEQAVLLQSVVQHCCWRGSSAETAAGLLTCLYEALQVQLLQARSQGGVPAAMLLRILSAACRPLLATLHAWLYRGVLHDPWAEFFIRPCGSDIPTDSPRFWSEAYMLRTAASSSSGGVSGIRAAVPAAPCFLQPLAPSILAAGKSALLLQAYSSWRLSTAAATGHGGSWAAPLPAVPVPAATADWLESPSKRRLSDYGALGFTIATGQQEAQQQPFGVPPAAAAALPDSLMVLGEGLQDAPGREPPPLHHQLLRNLEAQLRRHLHLARSLGTPCVTAHSQHQRQLFAQADSTADAEAEAAIDDAYSSKSSGSHACFDDWQLRAAACGYHSLLVPEADTLPALVALPASPEGLTAAEEAVILPHDPDSAVATPEGAPLDSLLNSKGGSSSSASKSSRQVQPSMSERMRQAAAVRVQQATCTAAEQLPLLHIPQAPPEVLAAAAAPGPSACSDSSFALAAADEEVDATVVAATEPQFDSSSWQQYYQQVCAALAQQLDVLDCLGGSGDGSTRQQLASSYGVPLGLPQYLGSPAEQLWGRGGGSSPAAGLQVQQVLLHPELAVEAPPLEVLLQHSLLQLVQVQVEASGSALCTALLRHGLLHQLAMLRDTYLLGSPLLEPFVGFLLHRISTPGGGVDRLSEFELNASLQDALVAGGKTHLFRVSAQVLAAAPAPTGGRPGGEQPASGTAAGAVPRVQQLARLRLRVEPGWPLSLVVGEEMLEQYNTVLILLLQLRWVKQSLQAVRYAGWKAGRRGSQSAAARDGLQHQMVHLVDSVLQYVTDRVVAAGAWLEQAVEGCATLDQMHTCRSKYLRAVTRYCLLSSEGVARLVHEGLLHLLNACLTYCALRKQLAAIAGALEALAEAHAADGPAVALLAGGTWPGQQAIADNDEEDAAAATPQQAAAGGAGLLYVGRRAELQRRASDAQEQLVRLRREFGNRQRLLLRVLSTKAAEAGSHADELRQLLGVLDYNTFFERGMY